MTGWTNEEYTAAFTKQGGCCALCGNHQSELPKGLAADHCHDTGAKRALLCHLCNRGLGFFKDDPELMRRAATYIESYATPGEQGEKRLINVQ